MRLSKLLWSAVALVTTAGFFWLALRADVYNATSPRGITHVVFGYHVLQVAHPWWLSVHILLRKLYSVIAFALVGLTVDRALGPAARPALRAAIIVGTFSFGIEIAQRLFVANEPNLESALDIGCGILGGWLPVFAANNFGGTKRRRAALRALRDP